VSESQYMKALEKANAIRLGRSAIKRQVNAGEMSVEDAMAAECCQSMKVVDLLMAQRRWGATKTRKLAWALGMSDAKTVGSLTDRQRSVLLDALARRGR
jgi:hypothetical protein